MTPEECADNIGTEVAYQARPDAKYEFGVIKSVTSRVVFVTYRGEETAKATPPEKLKRMHWIKAAAIKRSSDGKVWTLPPPARHHNIITAMRKDGVEDFIGDDDMGFSQSGFTQGFLLGTGDFVRRTPALRVAERSGQLIRKPTGGILTSEDVW